MVTASPAREWRYHPDERRHWSYPDLMERSGLSASSRSQELLFVVDGRLVVESGVEAMRVVPALDELEEGQPSLGVRAQRVDSTKPG
jgi:hypothetical protein